MTELWHLPAGEIAPLLKLGDESARSAASASGKPAKTTMHARADPTWPGFLTYLDSKRNDIVGMRLDDHHARGDAGGRILPGQSVVRQRGLPRVSLCRVINAIHKRLGEKMTLQDIADAACMSRFHFARLFRRSTGYSPMEYLLQVRLEQAKALLRLRAMRISDIAVEIGFADQSHLTRHFRRAVGMTPLQYARRCMDALPSETFEGSTGSTHTVVTAA
ncbi:helix-turn-helix transcriptional regulator [Dyella humicola]|uniref:helix-turn-helix transcriptional regulator n=1 Tax=Dyella humicola TaxID=2992126 RepID=UPI00224ED63A|nr:AraC family transcriptional regulator [Dyella humicola]